MNRVRTDDRTARTPAPTGARPTRARAAAGAAALAGAVAAGCVEDTPATPVERADPYSSASLAPVQRAVVMIGAAEGAAFRQIGTGFVVSSGGGASLIATNSHVLESIRDEAGSAARLVARRPEPGGARDFELIEPWIAHPVYERWSDLAAQPVVCPGVGGPEPCAFIPFGDVAVIGVRGEVSEPLPLAGRRTLTGLGPSREIVFAGFPSEGLAGPRSNMPASVQVGRIQAVTDGAFRASAPDDALLIHHDIPLMGGSSGGPILAWNPSIGRHEVVGVHAAVNHVPGPAGRVPIGTGYAWRADLVRDLLDASGAPGAPSPAAPDGAWAEMVGGVTVPGPARLDWLIRDVAGVGARRVVVEEALDEPAGARAGHAERRWTIDVRRGRTYVAAATTDRWTDIDLEVSVGRTTIGADTLPDAMPLVVWRAPADGRVTVTLTRAGSSDRGGATRIVIAEAGTRRAGPGAGTGR